jgi:hypothetical protein
MMLLVGAALAAPLTATTTDGRTVELRADGTWSYREEMKAAAVAPAAEPLSCDALVVERADQMTGNSTRFLKKGIGLSGGDDTVLILGLFSMQDGEALAWTLTAIGAGPCVDEDDKINVLFRDGSRLELENDGDFACDRKSTVYFGGPFGKQASAQRLAQDEVATIRVWTRGQYVQKDLPAAESKKLMAAFGCLALR